MLLREATSDDALRVAELHAASWGTLLDNLHVSTECHGRGLGGRLVLGVGGWCRSAYPGCGLYLWVLESNDRARRFYESMGASDRGGAVFEAPGGGEIQSRRHAWSKLAEVARCRRG